MLRPVRATGPLPFFKYLITSFFGGDPFGTRTFGLLPCAGVEGVVLVGVVSAGVVFVTVAAGVVESSSSSPQPAPAAASAAQRARARRRRFMAGILRDAQGARSSSAATSW